MQVCPGLVPQPSQQMKSYAGRSIQKNGRLIQAKILRSNGLSCLGSGNGHSTCRKNSPVRPHGITIKWRIWRLYETQFLSIFMLWLMKLTTVGVTYPCLIWNRGKKEFIVSFPHQSNVNPEIYISECMQCRDSLGPPHHTGQRDFMHVVCAGVKIDLGRREEIKNVLCALGREEVQCMK